MNLIFSIISISVLCYTLFAAAVEKRYQLTLPMFVPITGDEPRIGDACKAGSMIAFDAFNSNSDFLPDYSVVPTFLNEGGNSILVPKVFVGFQNSFLAPSPQSNMSLAPIVVGPFFTPGCKALASFVHQTNMVQIAIGGGAPQMTANRKLYPNMFRIRSAGDISVYATLHFIKRVGKWKQFAILTVATNVYHYGIATVLQQEAIKNNLTVPYFDVVADIDDNAITSLRKSDIRVIAFQVSDTNLITRFLCLTYKYGMTGPKYAFILMFGAYAEPDSLPDKISEGCTKLIVMNQLQYAWWTGAQTESDNSSYITALGYSTAGFEEAFDTAFSGKAKPADYIKRFLCHDAALDALMILDTADKMLKRQNMTLIDYRKQSRQVMQVVNSTAASISHTSLRVGVAKYSPRLEYDNDPQVVVQWTRRNGIQLLYSVRLKASSNNPYSFQDYEFKTIQTAKWTTKNGRPPVETPITEYYVGDVPEVVHNSVLGIALFLAVGQTVCFTIVSIKQKCCSCHLSLFFGSCFCFEVAAVVFSSKTSSGPQLMCILRPVMIVLALVFLQVFIWFETHHLLQNYSRHVDKRRKASGTESGGGSINRHSNLMLPSIRPRADSKSNRNTATMVVHHMHSTSSAAHPIPNNPLHWNRRLEILGATMVPSITILIIWLEVNPIGYQIIINSPIFDQDNDIHLFENVYQCISDNYVNWIIVLLAVQVLMLIGAGFGLYQLGYKHPRVKESASFAATRLTVANSCSLLFGAALLVVVLPSVNSQLVVLSFASLLLSAMSSTVVFYFQLRAVFLTGDESQGPVA